MENQAGASLEPMLETLGDTLALELLRTSTIWGDGNRKSPFCGGQEDVID